MLFLIHEMVCSEKRRRILNKHNNKSAQEIAEELVASRGLDWLGYDCENLVSDAICSYSPEVVRELLCIYTATKRSVSIELGRRDRDGISAFQIAKQRKELWPVLEEFGIDMYEPDLLHHPAPWGSMDMCESHEQRGASGAWAAMLAIQNVATLAYKRHKGQFRKQPDGRPYIVHPQAVYEMMLGWGYVAKDDVVSLCVAWGHDIIEEAKPEEREMIEREIANAGGEWGDAVLAGIKSLSFVPPKDIPREEHDRMKAAYLESVAENAPPDILVVKMADRLCNTLDFAKGDKGKARAYLAKGKCLFRRLDQMSHSEAIRKTLAEVESAIAD